MLFIFYTVIFILSPAFAFKENYRIQKNITAVSNEPNGTTCYSCSCTIDDKNRIVGGNLVQTFSIPWQAYIRLTYLENVAKRFICGGTLISSDSVLTAAHCFYFFGEIKTDLYSLEVSLGIVNITDDSEFRQDLEVDKILIHEDFSLKTQLNDIAILKLASKVVFTNRVSPVSLPNTFPHSFGNKIALVSGWGSTNISSSVTSRVLKSAAVKVLDNNHTYCARGNKGIIPPKTLICAYSEKGNFYFGDSGGPLVTMIEGKCTIIGVVSKNIIEPKTGAFYTRVSKFLPWLRSLL